MERAARRTASLSQLPASSSRAFSISAVMAFLRIWKARIAWALWEQSSLLRQVQEEYSRGYRSFTTCSAHGKRTVITLPMDRDGSSPASARAANSRYALFRHARFKRSRGTAKSAFSRAALGADAGSGSCSGAASKEALPGAASTARDEAAPGTASAASEPAVSSFSRIPRTQRIAAVTCRQMLREGQLQVLLPRGARMRQTASLNVT